MFRRRVIAIMAAFAVLASIGSAGFRAADARPADAPAFGFPDVDQRARDRARRPPVEREDALPDALAELDYDQYRDIRFKPESALWRGRSRFEIQLFHRGFYFDRRVDLFEVTPEGVQPIVFSPNAFDYKDLPVPRDLPASTGFAGFRVHYPLQVPDYKDELIVFLGASYFRALARNQIYGLSARGLAIDTATERGEAFPHFTDFWLVRPAAGDRTLVVFALLDSERVTGAYRFDVRPGATTQIEVRANLYFRSAPEKLGIAPLTSMFLFGEDPSGRRFDDFRPEVHDSDGLMVQTGHGEWLWRPLANPRALRVTRFLDVDPRGFGLSQRDRAFAHYQDNEARYERRPSYWIEPLGRWGRGSVELVELPSDEEIHDNIVAYWVPDALPAGRGPLSIAYLLSAHSDLRRWPPGGHVVATRMGRAAQAPGGAASAGNRIVIDFAGGDLEGLDARQPVEAVVTAPAARVDSVTVERLPDSAVWRVAFLVAPREPGVAIDLRCHLSLYGEALSETWTYLWDPPS